MDLKANLSLLTRQQLVSVIEPGTFDRQAHWYPKAMDATMHPVVRHFLQMDRALIIDRYCHLHPGVHAGKLGDILSYQPRFYPWAGADLMNVTSSGGKRQMMLIENNSCPSGQKSIPLPDENQKQGGYRFLMEKSFIAYCQHEIRDPGNTIAVLYDKNVMENSGYASVLADLLQRPVYLVAIPEDHSPAHIRVREGYLEILAEDKLWKRVTAAFRYVTHKPWMHIPVLTRTRIYNPVISCLAGGRNKLLAAKAYDTFNATSRKFGLKIRTPRTIKDVHKTDVPYWVNRMGGQAVIKVPYNNAGQGVYTILNPSELAAFMHEDFEYSQFIVQSLIGNYDWESRHVTGRLYHLGTLSEESRESYAFDIRMMICSTPEGYRPVCMYSRRAEKPLSTLLSQTDSSWDMLGTNLSYKNEDGEWKADTNRLILMDRNEFDGLGLSLDDLIEAFVQTVLSTIAIDRMAARLLSADGKLKTGLFSRLINEPQLLKEIYSHI